MSGFIIFPAVEMESVWTDAQDRWHALIKATRRSESRRGGPPRPDEATRQAAASTFKPPLAEAATFGLRTFADCLGADSPAEGFKIAIHALETHRKQKEKEAEARHKTQLQAEKAAVKPGRRSK